VPGRRNALVIGDSYSRDIANALVLNNAAVNVGHVSVSTNCQPVLSRAGVETKYLDTGNNRAGCDAALKAIFASDMVTQSDIVVLAANWQPWAIDKLPETLAAVKGTVVIVGPRMAFEDVPTLLTKYGKIAGADAYVNGFKKDPDRSYAMNAKLQRIAAEGGAVYVDMLEIFCPQKRCPILTASGKPTIYDGHHLTLDGARLFGERLKAGDLPAARLIFGNGNLKGALNGAFPLK
jgi:hypothetical protein